MGKVVRIVTGAAMVVAGLYTGNPALIFQGATMMASGLITPKRPSRQAQEMTMGLGERPRAAWFGEGAGAGDLVDAWNHGGKYQTDWEVLVIALADHRCHSLTGVFVNDKWVPFTGDGVVSGYNGQLEIYWRPGTEDQTLPPIVLSTGPGWTSNDNLAGICYVVVNYKSDKSDAKNPVWSGRPRFRWVMKGKLCYQARKDSSVGGDGPHRWDDPDTWEWTDNVIDCRYNYVRGIYACDRVDQPDMLLIGRGLTDIEAPPANVFAPANVCDELVAAGEGTEKRYRCGGVIRADRPYIEVEEMFAAACGGIIIQPGGAVEIEPGQARPIAATITDADIVVGTEVTYNHERSLADNEWFNTVVPRYVEPSQIWADHAAPIRRVYADVIADGGPREEPLTLELVTSATQAGRLGEIRRRLGQLPGHGSFTLGERFCALEEGDWIAWQSDRRFGGATKTFRIEAYDLAEDWRNTLSLREIASSVYADDVEELTDGAVAEQQDPPPAIGAPGGDAWMLTAELLTSGGATLPALVITGAVDDDYAAAILFEYWPDDGVTDPEDVTAWTSAGYAAPSTTRRQITDIASGQVYYAAVSYVVDGEPGERLILGPVTAGSLYGAGSLQLIIRSSFVRPDVAPPVGHDAGLDAEIIVPTHVRDYGSSELTVTGDTIGGLDHATAYYLYYDDATLLDTTPSFVATTDYATAQNSADDPARHYLGFVTTPAASAGDTTGFWPTAPGGGNVGI